MALDIEKVTSRLEPDLDEFELTDAREAMQTLEDQARYLMRAEPDSDLPRMIEGIIYNATVRYMRNYLGLTVSRAGDETLGWDGIGDKAGTPYFTDEEADRIENFKGRRPSYRSTKLVGTGWRKRPGSTEYVPVAPNGSPFPWREAGEP